MCHFTDTNAEIKSQLITGCLSEKVRQKGLMNPNMLLGDLINYAKTTETISKHLEQMRLEDANSTKKPTTSINTVANKVTHEQQWLRKRPSKTAAEIAMENAHMNGDQHPALHPRTSVPNARVGDISPQSVSEK